MKKALLSIALAVCSVAFADTYNTILHAQISPTNRVVTSIPTWAQSDTPPKSWTDTNEVNALIAKYDETNLTSRIDAKQDALPYATNAVPASVITNATWLTEETDPTVGLTNNTVYASGTNCTFATEAVTNGLATTNYVNDAIAGIVIPSGDRITATNGLSTIYADGTWLTRTNATAGVVETNLLCTVAAASAMTNGVMADVYNNYLPAKREKFSESVPIYKYTTSVDDVFQFIIGGGTEFHVNSFNGIPMIFTQVMDVGILPYVLIGDTEGAVKAYYRSTEANDEIAVKGDIPDAYTKDEADAAFATKESVPTNYLKSATSTATSISVYDQTNGVKSLEVQYGYELGAFTNTLSSGEIRSITPASSTAIPVTLDFGSDATKAADAMLYVDATALAEDVNLELGTVYTFIGDTGYQTATHGKKVIFYFTRINATTVIANKKEY